ncbi:MAG: MAE_28990/MAE_18760 family HEPN-like nuclease [Janthinobacterium lividum]
MPDIEMDAFRSEVEIEREWREGEMRLLKNAISALPTEPERALGRKALVVMLYSHFEGICRSVFAIYIDHLNRLGLRVEEAVPALSAAALDDLFKALRDPSSKCEEFRSQLPDDTALHRFARDREFIEQTRAIDQRKIILDPDVIANAESNLKPVVLRKILYRLGMDSNSAKPWEGAINRLLNARNGVAHGSVRQGVRDTDFRNLEIAVSGTVDAIVITLSACITAKGYRVAA